MNKAFDFLLDSLNERSGIGFDKIEDLFLSVSMDFNIQPDDVWDELKHYYGTFYDGIEDRALIKKDIEEYLKKQGYKKE